MKTIEWQDLPRIIEQHRLRQECCYDDALQFYYEQAARYSEDGDVSIKLPLRSYVTGEAFGLEEHDTSGRNI